MRRVLPWIMFLLMEVVLISLGVWQLQRRDWKETLLATRARNISLPAIALENAAQITPDMEYRRVAFACRHDAATAHQVEGFDASKSIAMRRYVQCTVPAGVVVDLGWHAPGAAQPSGEQVQAVAGRVRHWQGPSHAQALGGIMPVGPQNFTAPVAAFFVQAGDVLPPPPPNNHFAYAVQWFIFAGVLGVIFMLFQRRQRLAPRPPGA